MASQYWLSDGAWSSIEPLMPRNQPGARRVDDRRVVSGIIHVLRSGCRWQDCPAHYGAPTTIDNRFNRWRRKRLWGCGRPVALALTPGNVADLSIAAPLIEALPPSARLIADKG